MIVKYSFLHLLGFISKVFRKIRVPKFLCRMYNDYYHLVIQRKLNPYFDQIYSMIYSHNLYYSNDNFNSNIIWVFWWQGIQNAPLIVQKCVDSIIHYSNGHSVIIISKSNIMQYTHIPSYIYVRLNKGEITFTHFSDIVRFNLLRNYGGLWIDSTMYCTSNIIKHFGNIYTAGGYYDPYNFFVSSKWTSFLIGGCKGNPVFVFMDDFYKLYWKLNKNIIDYFLMDYALKYIYNHNIGKFKDYVNKRAYKNNPHLHVLQHLLNHKYNKRLYVQLTGDTNLFKLTYKKKFSGNKNTFYNVLIKKN